MSAEIRRLHDDRDVLVCRSCHHHVLRVLAEMRRFNPLRCCKCNGPLVVIGKTKKNGHVESRLP